MPKYTKKKYKKNKKRTSELAKRVKKLETITQNVVERNYWDNLGSVDQTAEGGTMVQDLFNWENIIPVGSAPTGHVNYGERLGDKITVTRATIKFQIRYAGTFLQSRFQRCRIIIFRTPELTGSTATSNLYSPSDILKLNMGDIDPTIAFNAKDPSQHYTVVYEKVITLGNPQGNAGHDDRTAGNNPSNNYSNNSNYRVFEKSFVFPKGLQITYDENGHVVKNMHRMLVISYNDVTDDQGVVENPDVQFFTRTNYIM
jgi:hypothetical protein